MLASFFTPGGAASSGWTSYAPLAVFAQDGQTWWLAGMLLIIMSSLATRRYLIVFGVLLGLTVLTVVVSSVPMPATLAIAVGLAIAAAKGTLVALFFMHVTHERMIVYVTLAFTAVFCVALTLWTEADHVLGTEFTQPFG